MKKATFCQAMYAKSSHSLSKLRMAKGCLGLGVYMCILEALFDEPSAMLPKEYDVIAFRFGLETDDVRAVVEDFNLFDFTDDGMFYCEMLLCERQPKKKAKETTQPSQSPQIPLAENTDAQFALSDTSPRQWLADPDWQRRTAATMGIDDLSELQNYIEQYKCACAEKAVYHVDVEDCRNGFILWLTPMLRQT